MGTCCQTTFCKNRDTEKGQKWVDLRHDIGKTSELDRTLKSEIFDLILYHRHDSFFKKILYIACSLYVHNRILGSSGETV